MNDFFSFFYSTDLFIFIFFIILIDKRKPHEIKKSFPVKTFICSSSYITHNQEEEEERTTNVLFSSVKWSVNLALKRSKRVGLGDEGFGGICSKTLEQTLLGPPTHGIKCSKTIIKKKLNKKNSMLSVTRRYPWHISFSLKTDASQLDGNACSLCYIVLVILAVNHKLSFSSTFALRRTRWKWNISAKTW